MSTDKDTEKYNRLNHKLESISKLRGEKYKQMRKNIIRQMNEPEKVILS